MKRREERMKRRRSLFSLFFYMGLFFIRSTLMAVFSSVSCDKTVDYSPCRTCSYIIQFLRQPMNTGVSVLTNTGDNTFFRNKVLLCFT